MEKPTIQYDRQGDWHYDAISAFIKSVRGSDPDAAVYWLAVMLEGGENPEFIARRLLILASEDIGLADPHALVWQMQRLKPCISLGCRNPELFCLKQLCTWLARRKAIAV